MAEPAVQSPTQTTLITGASSGIGFELARLFAQDGYNLVLVARDRQKLEEIAAQWQQQFRVSVKVVQKDLALATSPEEIFQELQRNSIAVDVLVNNAGSGSHGAFAESDPASQLQMLQLNVVALTHLTRLFLPDMIRRAHGKILNVASTAAFQPGPLMAVYYASKAYVLSFSEALANELRGSEVGVTVLCPGPTATDFQRRAGVEHMPFMRDRIMDAKSVALSGYRGLIRSATVVIPGVRNRLLASVVRWLPRNLVTQAVRTIQEKRRDQHLP